MVNFSLDESGWPDSGRCPLHCISGVTILSHFQEVDCLCSSRVQMLNLSVSMSVQIN